MTEAVTLADPHWQVIVELARGMLIRDAFDAVSGASMLWRREPAAPPRPSRKLPPGGPASRETFGDLFAGGWFPMFPSAGFTGRLDGLPTLFHGELVRLPWDLTDCGATAVEAHVATVRAPFAVGRRVALERGELRIETTVRNTGAAPASYTYGEHPCFPLATFAGGRIELQARAAWAPSPALDPERSVLAVGERFAWPNAPRRDGGRIDLSLLPPGAERRHDHACVELASPRVRIGSPRHGRTLELEVDLATTPYALVWEDFGEGVFALEPCSAPGRGVEDAAAAGAVRRLEPGATFHTAVALRWTDGGGP